MQTTPALQNLYEQDFVAWCEATVAQLQAGQLDQLDVENLIAEIDSLGKRDRRELKNRLIVLLAHLLKRMYVNSPDNFAGWELRGSPGKNLPRHSREGGNPAPEFLGIGYLLFQRTP